VVPPLFAAIEKVGKSAFLWYYKCHYSA